MKIHRLSDEMFGFHVSFVEGTAADFNRVVKRTFESEQDHSIEEGVTGHTTCDDQTALVWARDARRRGSIPTIVHELMHVTAHMAQSRGVPFRHENDEVLAYYLEMMTRKVLKALGHIH